MKARPAAPAQLELGAEAANLPVADAEPSNNNSAWIAGDSARTRFILVRHGVTAYSVERRFAGRSDLELTEDGQRQAAQAAGRVAELGKVDALVSSPLRRTRQTAGQLAERLDLSLEVEDGLIETDFGQWDGYTFAEIRAKWPAELASWLADQSVAPPGGESWQQVTSRVRRSRDRLLGRYQGKTVAVVSHVSPIKILVQLALAAPPAALHRMLLSPASVTVIDYYSESSPDGSVSLQSYNDTAHLSAG
ncbi:MAG: histidine phosphatase family protein [Jatrophihabitantaceae bacterium]